MAACHGTGPRDVLIDRGAPRQDRYLDAIERTGVTSVSVLARKAGGDDREAGAW